MFALAEILILPAIYRKMSLHFVTVVFAVLMSVFALYGLWKLNIDREMHIVRIKRELPQVSAWMWIAVAAIFIQIFIAVVYAHMDADDSFYVATATTSVQTNSVFQYNPYSGAEYRILPKRYVLSPFPVLLAIFSRLSGGMHPAVLAHTVYPAVFFAAAYLVYHQFGKMFFPERKREQGIFLLFCAVLIWFSGFSVYTAGNFQLVRIWQGKAVLASVILPFLMYLGFEIMLKEQVGYSRFLMIFASMAACHVSSMGIMLAPIVIAAYTLLTLWKTRSIRCMGYTILYILPSLILGSVYLML